MKMLLRAILPVTLLVVCASPVWADGASSPAELASKVAAAIAARDSATIAALYNWDGVPPDIAQALKESIEMMLDEPVRKAEVRPVPKDFEAVQELGTKRYKQNLEVEGVVTLIYSPTDESITATMPYGARNGKYYFSAPVPE